MNEHERRKAEMLALTGALLSLTARSSTGVTASAFAAASLIVVLTAAVLWSVITRAPNVPPAAPPLEIATRGIPEAASGSDPFKLVDAQPESTASVPLAKVQGAPVEQPSEPASGGAVALSGSPSGFEAGRLEGPIDHRLNIDRQ